jgi:hypothetical protein
VRRQTGRASRASRNRQAIVGNTERGRTPCRMKGPPFLLRPSAPAPDTTRLGSSSCTGHWCAALAELTRLPRPAAAGRAMDAAGAGESTPLLSSDAGGANAAKPAKREERDRGPFYGALRRTRRVAKALTNPWPRVRPRARCCVRFAAGTHPPPTSLTPARCRRYTRSCCAPAWAACCSATTPATLLSRCRCVRRVLHAAPRLASLSAPRRSQTLKRRRGPATAATRAVHRAQLPQRREQQHAEGSSGERHHAGRRVRRLQRRLL